MEEKIIIKGKFKAHNRLSAGLLIAAGVLFFGGLIAVVARGADEGNIFAGIGLGLLAIGIICHFLMRHGELTVTDQRVYGKIKFGRRVDLPLSKISSIGQGWFDSLVVATDSGAVRFWLLLNREEVFVELTKLIANQVLGIGGERVIRQEIQISTADEILKYKSLLDGGIITREEFEEQKQKLLRK